jgi:hypothetical protein
MLKRSMKTCYKSSKRLYPIVLEDMVARMQYFERSLCGPYHASERECFLHSTGSIAMSATLTPPMSISPFVTPRAFYPHVMSIR